MLSRINGRMLAAVAVVVLVAATVLAFGGGTSTRTLTAHFREAVSIYQGSDVVIMGVHVGRVTAVVPEGDSVRVDIEYDAQYDLPADVKAAIVTPTLVADRFVQLAPAYAGGPTLPDGGDIPLKRTAVPVELDRIYSSLADLTEALGPNGANADGALDKVLKAGAKALDGNGELGNRTLADLAGAMETLGDNSGQLFDTVERLAAVTGTLQRSDRVVDSFMTSLAKTSTQLAGERRELRQALGAIGRAVGVVRTFVKDNKKALVEDVEELTTTVGVLAKQRDTLATVLQLAPLGLGNLAQANDPETGTVGIRLQLGPTALDLGNILCNTIKVGGMPGAGQACSLLKALLPNLADVGAGLAVPSVKPGGTAPAQGLGGLLGGATGGAS